MRNYKGYVGIKSWEVSQSVRPRNDFSRQWRGG